MEPINNPASDFADRNWNATLAVSIILYAGITDSPYFYD
jgi:hypothetical protein